MKKTLSKLKNSKDGRTVASNFFYLLVLQFSGYLFPLITLPYLARVIGVEKFGEIAFATAIMVWLRTITDWGFIFTATRDVARVREDHLLTSKMISNVLWAQTILLAICFSALYLATETIDLLRDKQAILLVSFLLVPGSVMLPTWFFQAIEKMKFITYFELTSKAIFTLAVFIFIKERQDYILQPLLLAIGSAIPGIVSLYLIFCKWGYKLYRPNFLEILSTIEKSKDVFLNTLIPNLYNSFSTVLLGAFHGTTANGILDAGSRFSSIAQQVTNTLSRVFFPLLSRKINKHNLFLVINLVSAACLSITLFIAAPLLIKTFFTPEFYDAITILRILSISIIFLALSKSFGTNYLILQGHEKTLRNITFLSSIFGFALAWPLIYLYGFIGAALTITITRCTLGTSTMLAAIKIKRSTSL